MNQDWQTLLVSQGAEFDGQMVSFEGPAAEVRHAASETVIMPLTQFGVIRAQGADSSAFLQGQLSNDVQALDARHSQLNAYCNPKGRMLAQFRILPAGEDEYLLLLHRSLIEPTLKRLRMFVLRSQVILEDASDELIALGVAGPGASELLAEQFTTVPAAGDEMVVDDEHYLVRIGDETTERFVVLTSPKHAQSLWQTWSGKTKVVGSHAWEWLDIRAGLPSIVPQTVEEFVPLMLNLHHLNGVSFKKGCYPGQEIIARTHYLGKVKRRMYRAHSAGDGVPEPGTDIFAADGEKTQGVGKVVTAQPSPKGGVDMLLVLQVSAEDSQLHLAGTEDVVELQALPYSLDEAS